MKSSRPEGKNLQVKYHVITNVYNGKEQFKAELTIRNNSVHTLKNGRSIYFNSLRKFQSSTVSKGFQIHHINGDLFCLEPTKDFKPLSAGHEIAIMYVADYWAIKTVDKTERNETFDREWGLFVNKVGKIQFDLLHRFFGNIQIRVPPPGMMVKDNKLYTNTQFPDWIIRYTTVGSIPNQNSNVYFQPLVIQFSTFKMCAYSSSGNSSRVVDWVAE